MNEEFAIEPNAFEDYKDVGFVLGKFGFHQGRFISRLPSKWIHEVLTQIERFPDGLTKEKAKEQVIKFKNNGGLVCDGLEFDPTKSWLQNAISFENRFAGILVAKKTVRGGHSTKCRSVDQTYGEVDDDPCSFFGSCREDKRIATIDEFGRIATRLIAASHEITLVDPYMFINSNRPPSSVDVLKEFIRIGKQGKCKRFVVFTEIKTNEAFLEEHFKETNVSIRAYHVKKGRLAKEDREDSHPRYLLSKMGGIRFDKGFQPENIRRDVGVIASSMHEHLCKMFLDGKHGYEILGDYSFQG